MKLIFLGGIPLIDLIIPYYNNPEGLKNTIDSVNRDIFRITIVDDHSDEPIPNSIEADQIIRLRENGGPGNARQCGINHTTESYLMFLDTGDVFVSKKDQKKILGTLQSNPNVPMIAWAYYYDGEPTSFQDNRLHGKLYSREFLNHFHITFCPNGSYFNEDIGFNHTCRVILTAIGQKFIFIDKPLVRWIPAEDSLTRKNVDEVLFCRQTKALAVNIIHSVQICIQNDIDPTALIYNIAAALYYWFIRTAAENPQYIQEAWNGAKLFYDEYKAIIKPEHMPAMNALIKKCLVYEDRISFPVNLLRFTDDILNNDIVPERYKSVNSEK